MIEKPAKRIKVPKPLKRIGKISRQRAADKRAKLKANPPNHQGYHQCYIGLEYTALVTLEHIVDASVRPDLRHNSKNHGWACPGHNMNKKLGRLTPTQTARVQAATQEVLCTT